MYGVLVADWMFDHVVLSAVYCLGTDWMVSHVLLCVVYWVQIGWSAMFSCVSYTGYRLNGQPCSPLCGVLGTDWMVSHVLLCVVY